MPRLAANLSMLYAEHDFLDRFAAAAADGFTGVEYLFPYAFSADELHRRLSTAGLEQVLFNAPPGNWDAGERGIACLADRRSEFAEGIATALAYAATLRCPRVHVMAGLLPPGASGEEAHDTYVANLRLAASAAAAQGVDILIEPINPRDMPGYFLRTQAQAHALVEEIGAPNVKVQFDLYHAQVVEGDLAVKLRHYLPTGRVGHLQIAGVPERNEPDLGEVHYPWLFDIVDELGFDGWIGCEYRPRRGAARDGTRDGLAWAAPWLTRPRD